MITRCPLYVSILLVGFFGLTMLQSSPAHAQKHLKKRVAVISFEDKTDQPFRWGEYRDVGDGMLDMLITALVKSKHYTVLEREKIAEVLNEQDLGVAGITTPQTAAKVGQALGADLLIFGAVTEFGYVDKNTEGGSGGGGIGLKSTSAAVGVDVRMVNSSTGETVAAEYVQEKATSRKIKLTRGETEFQDAAEFDESLPGKAVRKAINKLVKLIEKQHPRVIWQGSVAAVRNGQVYINAGFTAGVRNGDRFTVFRLGEDIIDPETGLSLGADETEVGEIEVLDNQTGNGRASRCEILSGEDIQAKDVIRPVK